ncbi:MAG: indolepyruvate ferredoxin oxidoreductase subunit alpha [Thermoplasmata archaeon]
MLCNEAIVRGALEADVKLYAGYPGSPTTEILDAFYEIGSKVGVVVNISANEKVALETAAGAAMAGLRSLTSMKSVGLNVASDSFFSLGYVGVEGGLVLIVADDPHAHSSQSEQDGRHIPPSAYIPMLEPSDPVEALDMVKYAFSLSEKYSVPVVLRTTTRVNHQSGIVITNELKRTPFKKVNWPHGPVRFITVADFARKFKMNMLERTKKIEEEFEESKFNVVEEADPEFGIISSSAGYNYAVEACRMLGIAPSILKLGTTFPLPRRKIANFIRNLKRVLIVEELSPYLESSVTAIAKDANPGLEILGKWSGHLSEALEYNPNIVATALAKILKIDAPVDFDAILKRADELKTGLPIRPPTFCPGCPHRGTFVALHKALRGVKHVLATDIGCYSMSPLPPLNYGDTLLSMGASLGVAQGLQYSIEEPVIAMIGDSTFYHAGLPGLANAVNHKGNFKLIILDNSVTAMTGQQPHLGTVPQNGGEDVQPLVLEDVLKGFGVKDITIIDSYDVKSSPKILKEALARPGFGVIISRRVCALYGDRLKRRKGQSITPNFVDKKACNRYYACVREFYCPAISIDDAGQAVIARDLCDGCMCCSKLCPVDAIKSTGVPK